MQSPPSPGKRILSKHQFGMDKKDPHSEITKPKFSGGQGSKTMTIAGGRLPKPQTKHIHHRKTGKRTHRAK